MNRILIITLVLAAACGGGAGHAATPTGTPAAATKTDTLTRRQKDSVLAASKIPGAAGVRAAMHAADSTSAHINALDTVGQ
ncbi:MAG: hypothetical protein ACREL2_10075 [Gemmatimonadales bacterium]